MHARRVPCPAKLLQHRDDRRSERRQGENWGTTDSDTTDQPSLHLKAFFMAAALDDRGSEKMRNMGVADFLRNLVASQTPRAFPCRKAPLLRDWLSE